jgi:rubrerythrin
MSPSMQRRRIRKGQLYSCRVKRRWTMEEAAMHYALSDCVQFYVCPHCGYLHLTRGIRPPWLTIECP